jgi:hypothetical protein
MRKNLLLILLCGIFSVNVFAQACAPDPQYVQPGIYPDSATNFVQGYANQPYSQLITCVIPQDTQVIPPPIPPLNWDSTVLVSITNLPPGFVYNCFNAGPGNQSRCSWRGNTSGCAIITGNPTMNDTGTYMLQIATNNYVGGSTNPIVYNITYYKIVINAPSSVTDIPLNEFIVYQNSPNPFSNQSEIKFNSNMNGMIELKIFNAVGTLLNTYQIKAKPGLNKFQIDSKGLAEGVYLYSFNTGDRIITKRMVISK